MLSITVYTTGPQCMQCTMTKKALDKAGIPYVEVNIRDNDAARDYVTEELGYSQAPVCVVEDETGEDHWSGFRPDAIKRIAKRAILPSDATREARSPAR